MSTPASHAPAEQTASGDAARWPLVLRVLTVATFVVILNETLMVTAIPVLMDSFGVPARDAQWLSTAFMLTMAVVIPTSGWFLQRVSRRLAFGTAMGVFSTGTVLAMLAPTFEVLLAGRVVQAVGTAVMMPLLMTTLMTLVPPQRRGRVMGNVTLAISVAPALGPAVSGVVLQWADWRWLFALVLPVALGIGLWGLTLLRGSDAGRPGTLDLVSVALTAVGFGALVYGLSQLGGGHGEPGAASPVVEPWIALTVGVLGVGLFVARQIRLQRGGAPLLDLRVLLVRDYAVAVSIMALAFMAMMGAMILLPLYLQQARGLDTLQSGLLVMPGGVAMGLLGPRVGRLYDQIGPRPLVVPGSLVLLLALSLLTYAAWVGLAWPVFLGLHVVLMISLAFVFTPVFTTGLAALPAPLYAHGSALLGTLQQVAAAAGTALVVTVLSIRSAQVMDSGAGTAEALAQGTAAGLAVGAGLALGVVALALLVRRAGSSSRVGADAADEDVPDGVVH